MKKIFIHPTAVVDTKKIGAGTRVWAYTHIMEGSAIGANCNIGDHCFIENGSSIGDNTIVKNGNMLWEGITIEDGVFIGPHVFFTNDLYPRSRHIQQARNRYKKKRNWLINTLVKKGASLGAGAVIVAGIEIGEFSMVAAGAVVTKNVPPYGLVKGNPGRLTGWVCQCGKPIVFNNLIGTCSECRLEFLKNKVLQKVSLLER
jgi:acetyltransferase-like isoleucine patch superfamily enzyme